MNTKVWITKFKSCLKLSIRLKPGNKIYDLAWKCLWIYCASQEVNWCADGRIYDRWNTILITYTNSYHLGINFVRKTCVFCLRTYEINCESYMWRVRFQTVTGVEERSYWEVFPNLFRTWLRYHIALNIVALGSEFRVGRTLVKKIRLRSALRVAHV